MSTKLIQTKDYLLLIDEEAEINNGAIISYDRGKNNMVHCDINDIMLFQYTSDGKNDPVYDLYLNINKGFTISSTILFETGWAKKINIIAYYPLTKEAKELDLPLLPNPSKEVDIEDLAFQSSINYYGSGNMYYKNGFINGYKAVQAKQFSLEDVRKAIEMAKKGYIDFDQEDNAVYDFVSTEEEIVQSLSTQQLPKEFEPEYEPEYWGARNVFNPNSIDFKVFNEKEKEKYLGIMFDYYPKKLKTITNSEGREELIGTYKY